MARTTGKRLGISGTKTLSGKGIVDRLNHLAMNLWWSWNRETEALFAGLDPAAWEANGHQPILSIRGLTEARLTQLCGDDAFLQRLAKCENDLDEYLKCKTWFEQSARGRKKRLRVAYFSAEYAIHESMQSYAGGLGVLAGDHLKSASDLGIPLTAVGLLYRHGYYRQSLTGRGETNVLYPNYDYRDWPVEDTGRVIDIPMLNRTVKARVWRMAIGRTNLYLLDTDIPENKRKRDRDITRYLYGGDTEYRVQQEIVLGIGGTIALMDMGIEPTVYHLNEGHAAFCTLARLLAMVRSGIAIDEAMEEVSSSTVFTTHTPVSAGNDRFTPAMTWKYLKGVAQELGLVKEEFLALGREDVNYKSESFCMTVLALKLSHHANGVAELHGDTSRKMWMRVFDADEPEEVSIGHVTNGIHVQTWLAAEAGPMYGKYLKPVWNGAYPDDDYWENVKKIPDEVIWELRNTLRAKMITFIRQRLQNQIARRFGPVEDLIEAERTFDDKALTIGFARRFATYKRAPLIFRNRARLAKIMGNKDRPVQIVFAGKAHPRDDEGKSFIRRIYQTAKKEGFRGRVVILEDYDMHIGRMLTSGCDVWLNNPVRPMEASGTSGMKPALHGGINCSILDGWWPEGFNGKNGWAIGDGREFKSRSKQDSYDADCIYDLLEQEIVPRFYQRGRSGVPTKWVRMAKESMRSIPAAFSSHRMLADYLEGYYYPAHLGE